MQCDFESVWRLFWSNTGFLVMEENTMLEVLKDKKFILGVQWHPEISYDFDENSRKIINYFINKCKEK